MYSVTLACWLGLTVGLVLVPVVSNLPTQMPFSSVPLPSLSSQLKAGWVVQVVLLAVVLPANVVALM